MPHCSARLPLLLVVAVMMASPTCAQTIDDAGVWTAWFAQGDFSSVGCDDTKLRWWYDGHVRFFDDAGGFGQSIVRPGLGWAVNDRSTLWIGYGWIHTEPISGSDFDENRIWQQWTWSKKYAPIKLGVRARFEQRLLETGDDVGLRYRQFFRLQHELPNHPHLLLAAWDEVFLNLNDTDWGAQSGFNQNRLFLGVGVKGNSQSRWRTEIGYLHQALSNPNGADRSNHILAVNFFRSP